MTILLSGSDVELARLIAEGPLSGARFLAGGGGIPDSFIGPNGRSMPHREVRKLIYKYDGASIGAADYEDTVPLQLDFLRAESVLNILADLLA